MGMFGRHPRLGRSPGAGDTPAETASGNGSGQGDQPLQVGPGAPTALRRERITRWLDDNEFSYFVDNDGAVGGLWRGRLFYFFLYGQRAEILQVRGQWNREVAIERLTEILEVCNAWNTDRIWPKAYVRVRDNGMVRVMCETATDLEHGVTADQLGQLLHSGLSAGTVLFDAVDARYPDPAASPP